MSSTHQTAVLELMNYIRFHKCVYWFASKWYFVWKVDCLLLKESLQWLPHFSAGYCQNVMIAFEWHNVNIYKAICKSTEKQNSLIVCAPTNRNPCVVVYSLVVRQEILWIDLYAFEQQHHSTKEYLIDQYNTSSYTVSFFSSICFPRIDFIIDGLTECYIIILSSATY